MNEALKFDIKKAMDKLISQLAQDIHEGNEIRENKSRISLIELAIVLQHTNGILEDKEAITLFIQLYKLKEAQRVSKDLIKWRKMETERI